ncbi:hypothetical protein Tco_0025084 [Tanacetum coccineum]
MNEKGIDSSKSEVIKEESKEEVQEESKEEESTRKRKLGTRKKMKSRKRRFIQNISEDDSEKENDELRLHLTIAPDEEKIVDYELLTGKYPIKEWRTEELVWPGFLGEILKDLIEYFGEIDDCVQSDDENEFWNSQKDWNIRRSISLRRIRTEKMMKLIVGSVEDSYYRHWMFNIFKFVKKLLTELEPKKTSCGLLSTFSSKDVSFMFLVDQIVEDSTAKHIDIQQYMEPQLLVLCHRKDAECGYSQSLSNKFGGFHYFVKFGISGLLHHVITAIADRYKVAKLAGEFKGMDKSKSQENSQSAASYGTREVARVQRKPRSKALAFASSNGPFLAILEVIYNLKERKGRQGPNV